MEARRNISDYRNKLDKTLASPNLTNDEIVQTLVKKQIQQTSQFGEYSENVAERKSKEVYHFLDMLRSASANDGEKSKYEKESHGAWKVKADTEEFRVMYREGPEGTPFHSLLVEGYVDGPVDICLCISWESTLYEKWWPQTVIPTFKIVSSRCLKRVGTGEQISLVRMKVSWPLSSREALIHYFAFEYFQEGLIVVLLNSISDSETINKSTHGYSKDGIPDAEDVVRIDVVGGFAIQKVTENRSFFRTIANMDIKLDFVPPTLINFISRQLIGSGFKLYKKEVASVSKGAEKYLEPLKDPLYTRIRKSLYSEIISMEQESPRKSTSTMLEEQSTVAVQYNDSNNNIDEEEINTHYNGSLHYNGINEIEELEEKDTKLSKPLCDNLSTEITEKFGSNEIADKLRFDTKKKVVVSPEVKQALGTLEKVISVFRGYNGNNGRRPSDVNKGNLFIVKKNDVEISMISGADQLSRGSGNCDETSKIESKETMSKESRNGSRSHDSRRQESTIFPSQTNESKPSQANNVALSSFLNQKNDSKVMDKITENYSMNGNILTKRKKKKSRFSCFKPKGGRSHE